MSCKETIFKGPKEPRYASPVRQDRGGNPSRISSTLLRVVYSPHFTMDLLYHPPPPTPHPPPYHVCRGPGRGLSFRPSECSGTPSRRSDDVRSGSTPLPSRSRFPCIMSLYHSCSLRVGEIWTVPGLLSHCALYITRNCPTHGSFTNHGRSVRWPVKFHPKEPVPPTFPYPYCRRGAVGLSVDLCPHA